MLYSAVLLAASLIASTSAQSPFPLDGWVLQLPTRTGNTAENDVDAVSMPALQTYSSDAFKLSDDGGLTFKAVWGGNQTPGTNYTRTEFYETPDWPLASGTHRMKGEYKIDNVPKNQQRLSFNQILFLDQVNLANSRSYLKCIYDEGKGIRCIYELNEWLDVSFLIFNNIRLRQTTNSARGLRLKLQCLPTL
jgi:hypothetical protein